VHPAVRLVLHVEPFHLRDNFLCTAALEALLSSCDSPSRICVRACTKGGFAVVVGAAMAVLLRVGPVSSYSENTFTPAARGANP